MPKTERGYMLRSQNREWGTPQWLFERLNERFRFGLDPAASKKLHVCETYFDENMNGLMLPWTGYGAVFVNPPYGREIEKWVRKAIDETNHGTSIVMLLPTRTDTLWFHNLLYKKSGIQIEFLVGRLKFVGAKAGAPFPSMLVFFNCEWQGW